MTEYMIVKAPPIGLWVIDGNGRLRNVFAGQTTTLRADYAAALASSIKLADGGDEVGLPVLEAEGLDLRLQTNWTAAAEDGHFIEQPESGYLELIAYWDGTGGGDERLVSIANGEKVMTLSKNEREWSGRLDADAFGDPVLVHVSEHTGVWFCAMRKEGA